jgi:hypothetical protein
MSVPMPGTKREHGTHKHETRRVENSGAPLNHSDDAEPV